MGYQKKPDKIVGELLRNKMSKSKQKINNKINDNKNNDMNKGNIYRNINSNTNNNHTNDNLNTNLNNISHILPNKNNGPNKSILGFDFTNQISGPTLAGSNSYTVPPMKFNNMLDNEKYFIYINKNNKNIILYEPLLIVLKLIPLFFIFFCLFACRKQTNFFNTNIIIFFVFIFID